MPKVSLLPFRTRIDMLHALIHVSQLEDLISPEEAVQLLSVLCPICPAATICKSDLKTLKETEVKSESFPN